ncbi:TPA: hypothetical protein ACWM1T_001830 [Legionella pneumophila]|nr:hypothetical protein [Legionella pneumophila]HBD9439247.1 hypothetical protein [Legionella pneumophila]HEN8241119.1 hypothetical protein [Legionella pneumophila]
MDNKTMDKEKLASYHADAAKHYEHAAKYHHEAEKYHLSGDHDKAALAAHKAQGHACCANEHAKKALKCCAGIECK